MKKFILFFILYVILSDILFSQNSPVLAPLNPDFVRFMEKANSGKAPQPGTEESGTGAMPPPGQVNFDAYFKTHMLKLATFDPIYDLRTTGLLTPVKGQTNNACWAFATMASVESQWLKSGLGEWDLSENNLKYCNGFLPARNENGNHWMATAYFARRSGPLAEIDDPNSTSSTCPTDKIPVGYITDARYLPHDMSTIKQAILDHGAIFTLMYITTASPYYNPSDFTYYYPNSVDVNHAVDIVGWDDTKVTTGGTGAWICRNSWGTGWGQAGYFYVSYNCKNFLDYNAYWPTRIENVPNTKVYGYDDLGNYNAISYNGPVGYILVKFVATGSQILSKVGTYALASNEIIDIDVFDNFDEANNSLTGLLSHQAGLLCPLPGYYTFDLSNPTVIAQGNDFYIRIRYQTQGTAPQIPIEHQLDGYAYPFIESNVAWITSDTIAYPWTLIGNSTIYKWDPCVKVYAATLTWNGTTSDDWNTPANWSPAILPDATLDAVIPNVTLNPVVNQAMTTPAACKNLTINTGSSVTVNTDKALTVNGTLTNLAGNTGLIVEPGASLITLGNVTGTATVKQAVTGKQWHFISPMTSNSVSGIFMNQYLQTHTESTNKYSYINAVDQPLVPVKGYALWTVGDYTASYTGALNTGLNSISLTRTSPDLTNNGWNLVGNPYPSSIDWDAASGWSRSNVNPAIYVESKGEWATYISGAPDGIGTNGGTRYIAPGQGFFVSVPVDQESGTLAMDDRVRVHNATAFFKNADDGSLARLKVSGNGYSDEAIVRFLDEATMEYDSRYDALKLFGSNIESAQIYTLGNDTLTINSLPPGTMEVPLGIHAAKSGEYTLATTEIRSLDEVLLEDAKTGTFTSLSSKPYTFTFETGEKELRFKLYFNPTLFTGPGKAGNAPASIYAFNHTVFINLDTQAKSDILVYTLEGQLVATKISDRGTTLIPLPGNGVYIVKVISEESTLVKKVWIY